MKDNSLLSFTNYHYKTTLLSLIAFWLEGKMLLKTDCMNIIVLFEDLFDIHVSVVLLQST